MNWKPTGHHVTVEVEKVERRTAGGIVIPEEVADRHDKGQMTGWIRAVGPFAWNDQPGPWAQVGDKVKFGKFLGFLHSEDGVDYRVLNDLDIIMVERNDD